MNGIEHMFDRDPQGAVLSWGARLKQVAKQVARASAPSDWECSVGAGSPSRIGPLHRPGCARRIQDQREVPVSIGTIIIIAVGAVVVLLLIAAVARAASRRRDERHREQAGELRQEARSRSIQAESARASADEQAAQARRAQAEAEERAAQARQGHAAAGRQAVEAEHLTESARDQHAQARAIDPDASDSGQDEALAINARTG